MDIYSKGNITVLEEFIENDKYAPGVIFHKIIKFCDNETHDIYKLKQIIQKKEKLYLVKLNHLV